jgi:hypothetical protein
VTKEFSGDTRFAVLMDAITSAEFKERLRGFGGYTTDQTGATKYVNG